VISEPLTRARLVALFFLGVVLLNYPILSMASRALVIAGIPILFAYCFLGWATLILLIVLITVSKEPSKSIPKDGLTQRLPRGEEERISP
jgi:hypothetical protein